MLISRVLEFANLRSLPLIFALSALFNGLSAAFNNDTAATASNVTAQNEFCHNVLTSYWATLYVLSTSTSTTSALYSACYMSCGTEDSALSSAASLSMCPTAMGGNRSLIGNGDYGIEPATSVIGPTKPPGVLVEGGSLLGPATIPATPGSTAAQLASSTAACVGTEAVSEITKTIYVSVTQSAVAEITRTIYISATPPGGGASDESTPADCMCSYSCPQAFSESDAQNLRTATTLRVGSTVASSSSTVNIGGIIASIFQGTTTTTIASASPTVSAVAEQTSPEADEDTTITQVQQNTIVESSSFTTDNTVIEESTVTAVAVTMSATAPSVVHFSFPQDDTSPPSTSTSTATETAVSTTTAESSVRFSPESSVGKSTGNSTASSRPVVPVYSSSAEMLMVSVGMNSLFVGLVSVFVAI